MKVVLILLNKISLVRGIVCVGLASTTGVEPVGANSIFVLDGTNGSDACVGVNDVGDGADAVGVVGIDSIGVGLVAVVLVSPVVGIMGRTNKFGSQPVSAFNS